MEYWSQLTIEDIIGDVQEDEYEEFYEDEYIDRHCKCSHGCDYCLL